MKIKSFRFWKSILPCCFLGIATMAQAKSITGSVVSTEGDPVIGATVMVDGSSIGASTDADGKFSITGIPENAKSIIVTYVGMKKAKVTIQPSVKVEL